MELRGTTSRLPSQAPCAPRAGVGQPVAMPEHSGYHPAYLVIRRLVGSRMQATVPGKLLSVNATRVSVLACR